MRYFHELDAWTEYWDVYHPESRGRFYFGDGAGEAGLLTKILPRDARPAVFTAWTRMALGQSTHEPFVREVSVPEVAAAVGEVDALLDRLYRAHFGDAGEAAAQADYLEAIFRFATNTLPPATERYARIADDDPRKSTSGHHTLEGDIMWFAWALVLEAAFVVFGEDAQHARRSLLLAGVATGCPANYAWRGHRRTRRGYVPSDATATRLREQGLAWTGDFAACAREIHELYQIREWGE
jgi:hypothetical protein